MKSVTKDIENPWTARVISVFPEMFPGVLQYSLAGRALKKSLWSLDVINLRNFAKDDRKTVDGPSAGGGPGLILKPEVLGKAIEDHFERDNLPRSSWPIIALSPRGEVFNQDKAFQYASGKGLTMLCGRYEGFDQRVLDFYEIPEISVGDFILSGGEIAAQVLIDSVVRLIPHVVGNRDSIKDESFSKGLVEYPQYTVPRVWNGLSIPEVLVSGHHGKVREWRYRKAKEETRR